MTRALPVAHIGVLVADLEASRERWQRALGPFSPITRYRPPNWSDLGTPEPHLHDARLTFFLGDRPSIEILEFVGDGTHSPRRGEGGHHLSFPPVEDNLARRRELADLGVGIDGEIFHDGRWIFQFADAAALDGVYTEWVEEHPDHPDVKDDLSPVNRLADGSKTLFDVETIEALGGVRPDSGIVEIGVAVPDVPASARRWGEVIGYDFSALDDGSSVSRGFDTGIRLYPHDGGRRGLRYAVVEVTDLDAVRERLLAADVPHTTVPTGIEVDPAYLDGFAIRFRAPAAG